MRKLLFLLSLGVLSHAQTVMQVSFDHISYSSWQTHINASQNINQMRLLTAVAPTSCVNPATSGVLTEAWMNNGGGSGQNLKMNTSGKTPDTLYNVCPQILVSGTWYGGATRQVRTLSKPGGSFVIPPHAAMVNTAYPTDIVNGTYTTTTSSCANLKADLNNAVAAATGGSSHNTVITLPAGQSNGCTSTLYIDNVWGDELTINNSAINSDGSINIPSHRWNDGQALK